MQLHIHEDLRARIPGVIFGTVTINNVHVSERSEPLWQEIERLSQQLAQDYVLEKLSDYPRIAAVRTLQRSFGFDPTRYRPSSEALLRRVLKGQGIYQINSAVDVNNICSLEFLLPMCIYDLRHVQGSMNVRLGAAGEAYPGIGRQTFQIADKVIIADDAGIMGSTVSDSERTRVTLETTDIFLAIYAPAGSDADRIQHYAELAGQRMVAHNGGQAHDVQAIKA